MISPSLGKPGSAAKGGSKCNGDRYNPGLDPSKDETDKGEADTAPPAQQSAVPPAPQSADVLSVSGKLASREASLPVEGEFDGEGNITT